MPDPTAPERHEPLPNATCRTEKNHGHLDDVTHVCRWLAHASTTHCCKCGYMWDGAMPTFDERVLAGFAPALVKALQGQESSAPGRTPVPPSTARDGEIIRLRNRTRALEANGAELLARAKRAEADRDALIDEVKTLQEDLEEFGEAQKAWLQFRRERDALLAANERVERYLDGIEGHCSANRMDVPSWVGSVRVALAAPESPATASTAVTAATEAHGGAGEAQEGSRAAWTHEPHCNPHISGCCSCAGDQEAQR